MPNGGFRDNWLATPFRLLAWSMAILVLGWSKFLVGGQALYLIDYFSRGAVIVLAVIGLGLPTSPRLSYRKMVRTLAWGSVALVFLSLCLDAYNFFMDADRLFYNPLYPKLEEGLFRMADLTFGLVLVAISEEIVFRRLVKDVWHRLGWSRWSLYGASAAVFGLYHAPQGLALVLLATVSGLVLMALYRKSDTLLAPIAVHYLIDLQAFTGWSATY